MSELVGLFAIPNNQGRNPRARQAIFEGGMGLEPNTFAIVKLEIGLEPLSTEY